MKRRKETPVEILLVEDNPGDARLVQIGLEEGAGSHRLHLVQDGVEAMEFLRRKGPYGEAPRPDLVLLDLNLPKKDGREVLQDIKNSPELKTIPVIVLTTSGLDSDILKVYDLHANSYIIKPMDFERFLSVVGSIEDYWLKVVRLPKRVGQS